MLRLLALGLTVMLAAVAGDLLFRASLWRLVRPVIVEPADGAAVTMPVHVRWEGPRHMHVTLSFAGRESWDLGIHESPLEIPVDYFTERGLYSVEVQATTLPGWINASRAFSARNSAEPAPPAEHANVASQLEALEKSVEDMRAAQDAARDENANLYEENAAIREENAVLSEELNRLAESEQRTRGEGSALERRYSNLLQEHQVLLEEANQLRLRLASVIPCSVWGYVSYPRPQTIPPTRSIIAVSTNAAELFRTIEQCEVYRRGDPTNASPCFCVGNAFGG